ncbi:MAG TPA: alpha/beta family hydrolase [Candidatus Elarobacter sp.]|nr:MAG: dienelactone hydrolase [Deltaproteobacteria bacterium]HZW53559.1 alpha/beta family hydrolase [Candidatus Elarobacter sp.]
MTKERIRAVKKERITWEGGTVSAAWHQANGDALLALTHGAGGTMETPSLRSFAAAMAERGVDVVRFNLPYVEAGRKSPGPAKRDEACWAAVATHLRSRARRLYLGGRSYGGRMASHAVADGTRCNGLVFLAYPLHPPGDKSALRTAHLARITVPMLFLQGTRDAFADWALLERAVAALPRATLHRIENADHAHAVRGRTVDDVMTELADVTCAWMRTSTPAARTRR